MFNRTIEMNVVKKRKKKQDADDEQPTHDVVDLAGLVMGGMSTVGVKVVKLMACYIALDTARKIVVNRLSK